MSRSNPNENGAVNPSTRWFEWAGDTGVVRYYDKESKQTVDVGSDFSFMLLDQLGKVGGWHEATESAIYSNEVKDTRRDVLVVRSFKGGTIAEGLYKDIKERVASVGGHFVANCYIGYKNDDGDLAIGCIGFKGAALSAWMDFVNAHRAEIYTKGIRITGYLEGKKGRVVYRVPTFKIVDLNEETQAAAVALDEAVQQFLSVSLSKTRRESEPAHISDEEIAGSDNPLPDDDIPF